MFEFFLCFMTHVFSFILDLQHCIVTWRQENNGFLLQSDILLEAQITIVSQAVCQAAYDAYTTNQGLPPPTVWQGVEADIVKHL
jgi:hypothetical protein